MKKICLLIFIIFFSKQFFAQEQWAEILRTDARKELAVTKDDRTRFDLLNDIFESFIWSYPDSAAVYAQQSMHFANKIKSDTALAIAYTQKVWLSYITGSYPQALQYAFESLKAAERSKDFQQIAMANQNLSTIYKIQSDHSRAIYYAKQSNAVFGPHFVLSLKSIKNTDTILSYMHSIANLSEAYEGANELDLALKYMRLVEQGERALGLSWAFIPFNLGTIYSKKGEYQTALSYYRKGMDTAIQNNSRKDIMDICHGMANTFDKMKEFDSSILYANKVLVLSQSTGYLIVKTRILNLLAQVCKKINNKDSSAKYFELALMAKDTLFNQDKVIQVQNLTFNEQQRQQAIEDQKQALKKRITNYILISGLIMSMIIILMLNHSSRQRQKAKINIEKAYNDLKATQQQLIQSEKMASLGELTAGIAHEIQNPLNFVNNFSEVNTELLTEMKEEIDKGNLDEVKAIADDVIENEQKINHHGKRADAIVKGMLQHSQISSGQKEPMDINKLADEYLRLAYHGLRAKDKSFNVTLKTDFDETIGKINIIPQDIGRVFLNLYNNAFYAVAEKIKQQPDNYEPTVSVSTKKISDKVFVSVKDNGNGIPKKVIDKIFQPFFTTKPTGQGTGLGLSLSYDIVKAHGGEIKAETKEGEGAEFIIYLPVK